MKKYLICLILSFPIHLLFAQAEDDCNNPLTTLINGVPNVSTTVGATSNASAVNPYTSGTPYGDVWYQFTVASGTTHLTIEFLQPDLPPYTTPPNAVVQLVNPGMCDSPTASDYQVMYNGTLPYNKCVQVTPGLTYLIRISNRTTPDQTAPFSIKINELSNTPASINPNDDSGLAVDDGIICTGKNITLNANPTGVGYTYNWSIPAGLGAPATQATQSITRTNVAGIGTYTAFVTVTDNNGCTSTASFDVIVNESPTVTITENDMSGSANDDSNICQNGDFNLTATAGFNAYSWDVDGSALSESTNILAVTLTTLSVGNHTFNVTVTDGNGCTGVDNHTITIIANPVSNNTTLQVCDMSGSGTFNLNHATLSPDLTLPIDPSTNSNIVADVDNNVAGLNVTYHATNADAVANAAPLSSPYTATSGTVVYARVENPASGCFSVAEVTLNTVALPTGIAIENLNDGNSTTDFEVCSGAEINLTVNLGTALPPVTYAWDIDGTTYSGIFPVASANAATHDGVWTVTVTDANSCTGTDDIVITVTPNPANDICTNAITVNTGANGSLSNDCGTQDLTPCPGASSEASVWYSYTIPNGLETITLALSDITGGGLAVYQSNCTSLIQADCSGNLTIDCPEGQEIRIWVSTPFANMDNDFTLTITELAQSGNDVCAGAVILPLTQPLCQDPNTFSEDNTGACPELTALNFGGCDFSDGPATWYEFTTDANTDLIDIEITGISTQFGLFTSCAGANVAGSCTTDGTLTNLAVLSNTTYYLVVAGQAGAEGSFTINITEKSNPPSNDLCANATTLASGTPTNGTTSCATPFTPSYCGLSTTNSHTVFYEYNVPSSNTTNTNIAITITPNTATTGTAASNDINIGLFTDCNGTVYNATLEAGDDLCTALGNTINLECVAPGTTLIIAVGSAFGEAGDFSITVDESNTGVPANDLCSQATPIILANACEFETVNGNTQNACPENFAGNCDLDDFPTVWYEVVLPAGGVGFTFDNLVGNPNINLLSNNCTAPTSLNPCITAPESVTGLAPGTYLIAVRTNATGGTFSFDIKSIVPPSNDLCSNATTLSANTPVNGTTACATPFNTSYCGLSTTNSHTVFYEYNVPSSNTTNTNIAITITPNTATTGTAASSDINIGLFTDCNGTVYTATLQTGDDLCTALGNTINLECVAPGTTLIIAVGSASGDEGDFSINVVESNSGIPANDLCSQATPIILANACEFETVNGNTQNACPENFAGNCDLDDFPTVWYEVVLPAGGVGFTFDNLVGNPNINLLSNNCTAPTSLNPCITAPESVTGLAPGTYLIAVRTNAAGGTFSFDIKSIVPPLNDLCANAITLTDNTPVNGTTSCATPFTTSFCGLNTTNSHTVFYKYTVPASNTTNTNITVTITPNTATSGTAASGQIHVGLFTDCNGTLFNPDVSTGNPCTALGVPFEISCVEPGTVITFAIGSSDGNEGDFNITIDEDNTGFPVNDNCNNPTVINITSNCEFQTVSGTTLNACPEVNTDCNFDDFPTVWYEITLPAGGIGLGFEDLSAGLNIAVFNDACPATTINGACITADDEILGLSPGTYLIAVRNTDPGAAFDFDIKTILFLSNDNPCVSGWTPTTLSNASTISQDNSCATEDNMCDGNDVENSLWYSFTLGAGFDRITINVTGLTNPSIGIYQGANPCNADPINEECEGDGTVEFNCLTPGTYNIFVGTSAANAGAFTITATQGNNAGPANDFCSNATPITINPSDLCINLPFTSSNINACPDNVPSTGDCDFPTQETSWYTFTAPGSPGDMPTMDFTFTGYTGAGTPFMNLFTGPCSNLNPVESQCFDGLNVVFGNIGPLTPGTQYWIGISSYGDTGGDFMFNVKFNLGPPNDNKCHNASGYDLGSNGTGLGPFTNDCSGGDYIIPDCPPTSSENSVWFTFTVDPGSYGVTIYIDGVPANGNPMLGPVALGVFEDGCGSSALSGSACGAVRQDIILDCLEPGTYDLQISGPSAAANAGEFTINISQLVDDRTCPNGPLSDLCVDAQIIDINGIFCTPVEVMSCNTNACPETFNAGGCTYSTDPTVWFKFTVDADAQSIDIQNMTNDFYYSVLNGDPCNTNPPTAISLCNMTPNTLNIPVTGGQTYYIVVGSMNDGPFSFDLIQNVFPENDDPNPASTNPPQTLGLGDSHTSSTCCALGFNDGAGADFPNVQCSGATHDGAVWYRYTTGSEEGFQINVTPTGAGGISGPVTIEVLTGTATAPGGLLNPTSYSCGPVPVELKVGCYDPGEEVWIKIASATDDCGSFNITLEEINRCPLAELCEDATTVIVTNPTDPNCGSFIPVTVQGCLEAACPETVVGDCGFGTNPTVWFQVMIDEEAVQLGTSVTSNGSWDPVWAIYYGGCDDLTITSGSGPNQPPVPCSNSDSNTDIHTVGTIMGELSYWIAVSGDGVIDDPTFTLNVWTSAACVACIGEDGCEPEATWEITSRTSDRPLDDPLFCQGEDVTVCISYLYDASETGVDWLHGLIPDFGPGWDMDAFDPGNVTVSPGNPVWADESDGACAPFITEQMPYLCTYTDPITGVLRLCHTGCQQCPCAGQGPLRANAPLPSGWFWNSTGGGGCANDCSPSTHYGIGQVVVPIEFCVDLKVKVFETEEECFENKDLHFNFQTTSDGVSGCWEDPVAECKLDFAQIGPKWEIDCERPPKVIGNDQELCTEGMVEIDLTNEDGSSTVDIECEVLPNSNVTGQMDHTFPGGFGTIDDYLTNIGTNTEVIEYVCQSVSPNFICPSPKDTFRVTIYPAITVTLQDEIACFGDNDPIIMTPIVSGGTGNYVTYNWQHGPNTSSITAIGLLTTTTFVVTVTDDEGCSGSGQGVIEIKPPVNFNINPEALTVCGGLDDVIISVEDIVANSTSVNISWNVPFGVSGTPSGSDLIITPAFSNPGLYEISVGVTDAFGCTFTKAMQLNISAPPSTELLYDPFPCGTTKTDLHVSDNWYNPGGNQARITLLDCTGNIVQALDGSNPIVTTIDGQNVYDFFNDVDLSVQNCFVVLIQTLDPNSGDVLCEVTLDPVTIPIPMGAPVNVTPAQSICAGNPITIGVTSATAPTTTFAWSPGTLPNSKTITVNPTTTTQYTVTVTESNGCTTVKSVVVTLNELPTAGITGSITFCPGESTELTANGGTMYQWVGPAPFTASTANTGPINIGGTYSVTVTDANGCTDTETVNISQSNQLTVVIADLNICDYMEDTLDAGIGFDTYVWKNSSGDIIGNSQKVGIDTSGIYTVEVSQGSCSGIGTAEVINNFTPITNIPDTLYVCRSVVGTQEHPSTINFSSFTTGISGAWINTNSVNVVTTDWSNVDFTTSSSAGSFYFHFITDGAILPCNNITDSVLVNIENCICPTPVISFPPQCNDRSLPLALNSGFVNTSFSNNYPGSWTVVAGNTPYPPIVMDSLIVLGANAGLYGVRYTISSNIGNCPTEFDANLTINAKSNVEASDFVLCNQNIGAGPTSVDLNTLLKNLVEPSPGSWFFNGGPVTNTTIDATGMLPDTLIFTYKTTATAPCSPEEVDVMIRIRNCNCPDVTLVDDTLCNGSNVPLNLEDPTKFSVVPSTITGTWSVTSPLSITNDKFINPNGIDASTNYIATFTIDGNLPSECQKSFDKFVIVRNQPEAVKRADPNACSVNTGNGPTTINLFAQLLSGYTSGGTWTQISPASPQLQIKGPGAGQGDVDFSGQTVGTEFVFRYSLNANAPCSTVNVDIKVTVVDCNCPNGEIACPNGVDGCDLCNDNDVLDVTTLIVDPTIFAKDGIWSVLGPGATIVPLVNGNILDAKGLPQGKYKISYQIVPKPSGNCPEISTVELDIKKKILADITSDTLLCNGPVGGITTFNLGTLNPDNVVGVWTDKDGLQVPSTNEISIQGLANGSTVSYTFTVQNQAPCENSVYPVTINITNNCQCPPFNLPNIPPICANTPTFDLTPFRPANLTGIWSSPDNRLSIINNVITLNNTLSGTYKIRFSADNQDPDCPQFKEINISISQPISAGTARGAEFCVGATDIINLYDRLDNESLGGQWIKEGGDNAGFNANAGTFNLAGRPAGSYVFKYAFTGSAPCPDDEEIVTITINQIPVADAGTDKKIDCDVQQASLGTNNSSVGTNIVYEWKLDGKVVSNDKIFTTSEGGTFVLTVLDTVTKCSSADEVFVDKDDNLPSFTLSVDTIACFGQEAKITVSNISGGKAPYQISFDGGATYGTVAVLEKLKSGTFKVQIKDANGCVVAKPDVTIIEPPLFSITLIDDFSMNLGDDTLLSIIVQYDPLTVKSITWKANGVEIASAKDQGTYLAIPEENTTYSVTVVNQSGCIANDDVTINIKVVKPECVPNVFSPNGLEGNNFFSINCKDVDKVTKYSIYDRWGNLIFTAKDLSPSQPESFWDGKFNGKPVVAGVYVYSLELLFKDGTLEPRAGDVTVIDPTE
jgi:gliding motility-associated-like protein